VGALLALSRAIDAVNFRIGKVLSWLVLVAVLISATNATVRRVFDVSSNAWPELQWILFSVVFLLCSPWTLLSNEHIRIDIVNNMLPKRARSVIDVFGHLFFLLPMTFVLAYLGWPFFWLSLMQNEQSTNAGGLPVYPAKFLIPLAFTLLFVQAISELIKRIAIMRGDLEDTISGGGHHDAAAAEAQRLIDLAKAEAEQRSDVSKASR
jgi:TRAP-type mannitol/chloroaromatic compound transport system permease small subunit